MNKQITESTDWNAKTRRNTIHLAYWTVAWTLTMALATFGPIYIWDKIPAISVMAIVLNFGLGIGMILANRRHLRGLDEMHQKIFRDAAVLSLGVGMVCAISYELLEDIRLITFEPEISHVIILMTLTFLAGVIIGNRKYR